MAGPRRAFGHLQRRIAGDRGGHRDGCQQQRPINPVSGIFASGGAAPAYVLLTTLDGDAQETIKVASWIPPARRSPPASSTRMPPAPLLEPLGAFATGIIPPTGMTNGSSATVLKLYGDIISDGSMVYVDTPATPRDHNLYRNVMPFTTAAASKPALTNAKILLGNVIPNPGGTALFHLSDLDLDRSGHAFTFVLDVAVTLTVETEQIDPITRRRQTETKALLNVSPRNVFNAWTLAGIGYTDRIQSTPATVSALLP